MILIKFQIVNLSKIYRLGILPERLMPRRKKKHKGFAAGQRVIKKESPIIRERKSNFVLKQ